MHILDLPPELHTHIAAFACAHIPDEGERATTHALSLVSSYWYSVARPFKYYSLRVNGTQAIAKLLEELERIPERGRHVRYLSLSDAPIEATIGEEDLYRHKSVIARLLSLITSSLFVLELHLLNSGYATSLFALLWTLPAPHLVSLSIRGLYPFPTPSLHKSTKTTWKSNFLSLEHLSLEGVANPSGLLSCNALERVFPKLTTLKVHGLRSAVAFAREVVQALEHRDERSSSDHDRALSNKTAAVTSKIPQTLVSLSLFSPSEPAAKTSKRSQALHSEMLKILVQLTARDELKDKSVLKLEGNGTEAGHIQLRLPTRL